jgi:hypothetical protein
MRVKSNRFMDRDATALRRPLPLKLLERLIDAADQPQRMA